jgi:hypothetical protein
MAYFNQGILQLHFQFKKVLAGPIRFIEILLIDIESGLLQKISNRSIFVDNDLLVIDDLSYDLTLSDPLPRFNESSISLMHVTLRLGVVESRFDIFCEHQCSFTS